MEPYYEAYLTQKGARNEDSAEMLQLIRDTRIINTGYTFGWTNSLTSALTTKLENGDASVASTIAAEKDKITEGIRNTLDALK